MIPGILFSPSEASTFTKTSQFPKFNELGVQDTRGR